MHNKATQRSSLLPLSSSLPHLFGNSVTLFVSPSSKGKIQLPSKHAVPSANMTKLILFE